MISSYDRNCPRIRVSPALFTLALLASMLVQPRPVQAVTWSTLFTAQDVRDHLATEQGRQEALAFCRKMGITKVYIETFRGYQADEATLKAARDFFRQAGLRSLRLRHHRAVRQALQHAATRGFATPIAARRSAWSPSSASPPRCLTKS